MSFPPPGSREGEGEDFDPFAPPSPFGSPEPSAPLSDPRPGADRGHDEWSAPSNPYGQPTPYPAPPATGYTAHGGTPSGVQPPVGYLSGAVASNQIATWALILAILGLCCGLLSIGGFVLSLQAKQAVAQGRANNGGIATAAMVISVVTFVLSALIVMANLTN